MAERMYEDVMGDYRKVCQEQNELRAKLQQVNMRKMLIAVELTRVTFEIAPKHLVKKGK